MSSSVFSQLSLTALTIHGSFSDYSWKVRFPNFRTIDTTIQINLYETLNPKISRASSTSW